MKSTAAAATFWFVPESMPAVADQFQATLVWMHDEPDAARPARTCSRSATRTVTATITTPKYKVNVNTLEHLAAKQLELNEIGVCNIGLDQPIRLRSLYRESRHRRLHPDRQADERHGVRRACSTLRCGARRTFTGRRWTSTSRRDPP